MLPTMKIKHASLYIISLFLVLSLIPFIDNYFVGLYNEKRAFQVIALLLSLAFIPKLSLDKKYHPILFLLVFCVSFSLLFSENKLQAILNFLHFTMLISFINLGFNLKDNVSKFFLLLFFCNLFVVSFSLLNYLFYYIDEIPPNPDGVLYGFYNIRFFNQFQVLCIPFVVHFLRNNKISRIATTLLVFNIFLLFISGARGALLSCIIMLALSGYLKLIDRATLFKIFYCCLISLFLFILHVWGNPTSESLNNISRVSSSNRVDIWFDLISQLSISNFIIGNGPGVYFTPSLGNSHPHNSFLQLLYNWGGVITVITLFFLFNLFRTCTFYIKNYKSEVEFNICFLALSGLTTYSFVSGVIVMPIPQTFIFVLLGLVLSHLPINTQISPKSVIKSVGYISLSIFYIFFVIISYNCLNSKPYGPNFWSNGQLSFSQCKLPYNKGN